MPRAERAKQFMPFDALKGLKQALREKEIEHESRLKPEISEDETKQIADTLFVLKNGDEVNLKYFENGFIYLANGKIKLLKNDQKIIIEDKILEIKNIVFIEKV